MPDMPRRRSTRGAAAAVAAVSLALAGCSSSSSSSQSTHVGAAPATAATSAAKPPPIGKLEISISSYSYHPATIMVAAGTKVTFINRDQTSHTATGIDRALDTGTVSPGRSATVVLTKPGTYTYYCQFHAFMQGTIVVLSRASAAVGPIVERSKSARGAAARARYVG
jgi:plastocyanin